MVTLTPEDAELVANAVLQRSDALVDAVVKRLAARDRVQSRSEKPDRLYTYAEVGDMLGGKSANAVKMMVHRKILRAVHPRGGRAAYIDSRELASYMEGNRRWRTLDA